MNVLVLNCGSSSVKFQIIATDLDRIEQNADKRLEKWSGRRGSNSQLSAWEAEFSIPYFQYLQNHLEKMYVHALHTVHAVTDLRVVAGRLRDGF